MRGGMCHAIHKYTENTLKYLKKYTKHLHNLHRDLPFLPGRIKINKCNKLVCNLDDENKYFVQIRALKQELDQEIILEKIHRVIEFN